MTCFRVTFTFYNQYGRMCLHLYNNILYQIWRIKTKEELDKLIKHKNIVNCIKAQRLSWFGHVQRMPDARTIKKIFKWKPLTKNHKEDQGIDGRITLNRIFAK